MAIPRISGPLGCGHVCCVWRLCCQQVRLEMKCTITSSSERIKCRPFVAVNSKNNTNGSPFSDCEHNFLSETRHKQMARPVRLSLETHSPRGDELKECSRLWDLILGPHPRTYKCLNSCPKSLVSWLVGFCGVLLGRSVRDPLQDSLRAASTGQ